MGWITPELPFAESPSPIAQSASFAGAVDAKDRAANQTLRYLELLAKRGPTTDQEAADLLGWMRSTVNARRGALKNRGIVVAVDRIENPATGVVNTRWGLAATHS
jgi:predicted ArsR family transcriptional regulator